ncbi:hypothetical protein [Rhodopseudomonas sp. BR0G17]|uniref:hypothetical protein n=1 Tax=Rhodopseudomonas sp. BR0G17 TaxID=2269368 RepID=UPI0013DEB7D1|nr:hypothetical protein [Rhodopseudomonas sp. BR0G17]NEW96652.1 hypothetical protein [Rhodopseudomonas sp. BR0G17]
MQDGCEAQRPAPLRCPTLEESITATLGLLPRGRAWPARDLGLFARYWQWLFARPEGVPPASYPAGYVQIGFFAAIGAVRNFVEKRLCDLRLEFWCATQTETRDLWMAEYGLPDACDPFPDLCAKVAALGGATCEYYTEKAAAIGWSISCGVNDEQCGAQAGCAYVGDAITGGVARAARIYIDVSLGDSPAYAGAYFPPPIMGCLYAGDVLACEPDITPLVCLLDRIVQAHIEITYRIIPPPTYIVDESGANLAADDGALLTA